PRVPERPLLRIVGGPAPGREGYLAAVQSAARTLGVETRVRFDGVAEAAASATPVVARRTTGLVDAVRDGVSGVLVDSADPDVWATAVLDLLRRPRELARLGLGGTAWAAAHSWSAAAERLDDLYRRLLSR
ncbi:glycosyltransferase, partial [Rathayibacter sp. ZW T2_19]